MLLNRWALFLSGRGSTAQAVMDLGDWIDIRLVVSNKPQAQGLLRARRMGIPTLSLENKNFDWEFLQEELRKRKINYIFLLGFMKLIPENFLNHWQGRVINVHPSLLPKYPGLHAMEKSFQDQAEMGVSVHWVTPEMDAGPLLLQTQVLKLAHGKTWQDAHISMAATEQRLVRRGALMIERQRLRNKD